MDQDSWYIDKIKLLEEEREKLRNQENIESRLKFSDIQTKIAAIYEQRAVQQIGFLLSMKKPVEEIVKVFRTNPITLASNGFPLGKTLYLEHWQEVRAAFTSVRLLLRYLPSALGTCEKVYLSLINPPYLQLIPRRKEPALYRKILDIQKIGILRAREDSIACPILVELKKNIEMFSRKYEGKFPHFLDYLKQEKVYAASLATLRTQYRAIFEVFTYLNDLDNILGWVKSAIPKPHTH